MRIEANYYSCSSTMQKMGSWLWLVVCVCTGMAAAQGPEQVHISFGYQPSQMIVMWSTEKYGDSLVVYGKDQFHMTNKQSGSCWQFTDGNPRGLQYIHRVLLEVRAAVLLSIDYSAAVPRVWSLGPSTGITSRRQVMRATCSTSPACPLAWTGRQRCWSMVTWERREAARVYQTSTRRQPVETTLPYCILETSLTTSTVTGER